MIQIFLDETLLPFESDIRELCKAFYPGEDFQMHTPEGVRLMETTQEEKNALKRAKEQKSAVPVNKKSLKRKDTEKQNRILTEEGFPTLLFSVCPWIYEVLSSLLSAIAQRTNLRLKLIFIRFCRKNAGEVCPGEI